MIRWPFGKKSSAAAGRGSSARSSRSGLTRKPDAPTPSFVFRGYLLAGLMAIGAVALTWKAVTLQLVEDDFLRGQGAVSCSMAFPEMLPKQKFSEHS